MAKTTLFPNDLETLTINPQNDASSEIVEQALRVVSDNQDTKIERDNKNEFIMQLFENGFTVNTPTGPRKIHSKMLYQALWKVANRMKPLDFQLHGTGRPEANERLVTAGVATSLDKARYVQTFRDKGGVFHRMLTFGDAFYLMSANDERNKDEAPIKFEILSNSNIYVDPYATQIRGGSSATKMVVVSSYSFAEVRDMFPRQKDKIGPGQIPRDTGFFKEQGRTYLQTAKLEDITEVAHFFDISNNVYAVFVGAECTLVKELHGDKYPFMKDGEPYIPVGQFICMPAIEGFYNHGIGDMIYELAIIQQSLMNMEIAHVQDNTYPMTLVNVPQGEAASFFQKMGLAQQLVAAGQKGMIAMEYGAGANPSQVSAQTLLTQNLTNEWQLLTDRLDRELMRMGINLDEIERGSNVTASQVLAEEESANSFVKQIMEYNASETQFLVEVTMDLMKKFIRKSNKTPLNLTTRVQIDGVDIPMSSITLGGVADELKEYNYFVKVNSRSGSIPSNTMERAQVTTMLQVTPPGTPAYGKLMEDYARLNDRDFTIQDISGMNQQMPEPGAAAGGAPTGGEDASLDGTQRASVNPYARTPQAVS